PRASSQIADRDPPPGACGRPFLFGGLDGARRVGPGRASPSTTLSRPLSRGPSKAREPGIHTHGSWLWIPGSPLRGRGMTAAGNTSRSRAQARSIALKGQHPTVMSTCSGRAMSKRKKKSESKALRIESKTPQVEGKSPHVESIDPQAGGGFDPFLTLVFGLAVGAIVVALSFA